MAKTEDRKKALNAEISKALMTDFERLGQGFLTYWKLIAIVVIGLALLIAAIGWAAMHQKKSARTARETLAAATNAEELANALKAFGGSPAAPAARFRLAGMHLQAKQYDKAINELKQVGSADGNTFLAANAALTEGYALELAGKADDAAAKFAALAELATAPAAVRAEARYAAGRLYLMQKNLRKAAELLTSARPNNPPQSVADGWNEQSAALLRAVEAGEYGPFKTEPAGI